MKRIRRLLGHDRPRAGAAPLIALLLVPTCFALVAWKTTPPKSSVLQAQGPDQTQIQPQPAPRESTAPKPVAQAPATRSTNRPEPKPDIDQSSHEPRRSTGKVANSRELEDLSRAVEQIRQQIGEINNHQAERNLDQVNQLLAQMKGQTGPSETDVRRQLEQLREAFVLVENSRRQQAVQTGEMTRRVEQLRGLVAQLQVQHPQAPRANPYQLWLEEDVAYIITPQEKAEFQNLETDQQRQDFIERFWQKRDPTPGTPRNEFQEEHYRRIAYADDHFGFDGTPGWRTDRARIYITFGPPDERTVYEKGGLTPENKTISTAFELWRYRFIDGVGRDVFMEFIDTTGNGNYRMTRDPAGPDAGQRYVPEPR